MSWREKLAAVLAFTAFTGDASATPTYHHPHELLVKAIGDGTAAGLMVGPIADHFTTTLQSKAPLKARARVLKRFQEAGCARLELVLTKDHVNTPKGMTSAVMTSQMNYCVNGKPPEGVS
jgi:hypothetical protein